MDNFDLKKFLKESKALENLNPSIKAINEGNSRKDMKAKIKDMIVAELEGKDLEDATKQAEKGNSTDLALHMAGIKEFDLGIDNTDKISDAEASLYDDVYEGNPGEEEAEMMDAAAEGGFLEEGTAVAPDNRVNFLENVLIEVWEKGNDGINVWFRAMAKDLANSLFDDQSHELEEAKKKDEEVEDVEITDTTEELPADKEMPAEEAPAGGIEDLAADMKGTEADLMDHLMKAFQISKGMGNEKLETQVGNTLKFFVSEYIGGSEG